MPHRVRPIIPSSRVFLHASWSRLASYPRDHQHPILHRHAGRQVLDGLAMAIVLVLGIVHGVLAPANVLHPVLAPAIGVGLPGVVLRLQDDDARRRQHQMVDLGEAAIIGQDHVMELGRAQAGEGGSHPPLAHLALGRGIQQLEGGDCLDIAARDHGQGGVQCHPFNCYCHASAKGLMRRTPSTVRLACISSVRRCDTPASLTVATSIASQKEKQ